MKKQEIINKIIANLNDYGLLLISLTAIFGAIIYYFYALNWFGAAATLILTASTFFLLAGRFLKAPFNKKNYLILNKKYLIFFLIYLSFAGLTFLSLYSSQSTKSLISPWQVLDWRFFAFYLSASLVLILALREKNVGPTGKLFLLSLHYFLSLSIAVIIYQIGYGFDPFIHQATMELIDKKGLVTPKPPYYLGEYSLVIILHKISGLTIYWLNKILVPLLTAIFLPVTLYRFLNHETTKINPATPVTSGASQFLAILFLLGLTFSPFTVTTPQNLSYLFLLLTIFAGLGRDNPLWVLILSLATAAIHPLTGIPAILFAAYIILRKYQTKLRPLTIKIITFLIFLGGAFALPLALLSANDHNSKKIAGGFNLLFEPFKNLFTTLSPSGREDWLSNFLYFFGNNYSLLLLLVIAGSLWYFYHLKPRPAWRPLVLTNLALIIAYVLASQIRFHDLINYEQTNYAERILVLVLLFCLPFIGIALTSLIRRIQSAEKITRSLWLVFGLALLGASLYFSYPRFDKYFNSRGYSVGNNDLLAVETIAQTAQGPYIVLANQQVSVAALKKLGFDHYYQTQNGEIYFYPIPTGGPLYQYYLEMVYKKPDRATMAKAMDLAGVNEGYLVINKYWYESAKIINEAKLNADNSKTINDDVYIFKYTR